MSSAGHTKVPSKFIGMPFVEGKAILPSEQAAPPDQQPATNKVDAAAQLTQRTGGIDIDAVDA
jgi:hypothetical protein